MGAMPHRIEAMPGDGRYALTFRLAGGGEHSVVVQVSDGTVTMAAASLPGGWDAAATTHDAVVRAVLALDEARATTRVSGTLADLAGGWDVSLGNVVLGYAGVPECAAHGPMVEGGGGLWSCTECGAQAVLA